jgi:hypothetical protein
MRVRDRLWLWGMRVNVLQTGGYPKFARSTMSTEEAIRRTGITNVLVAGGLPLTRESLDAMPSARRLICKASLHRLEAGRLVPDVESGLCGLRAAKALAAGDRRVEGFLVDDFSTGSVEAGVTTDDVARLVTANRLEPPRLPLLATVYTMSLGSAALVPFLPHFEGYLTPLWHAAASDGLAADVARLAVMGGGKPQLLCLYLYDFGNDRELEGVEMARQLATAGRLLEDAAVAGVVILGTCLMDLGFEAMRTFEEWLGREGDRTLA